SPRDCAFSWQILRRQLVRSPDYHCRQQKCALPYWPATAAWRHFRLLQAHSTGGMCKRRRLRWSSFLRLHCRPLVAQSVSKLGEHCSLTFLDQRAWPRVSPGASEGINRLKCAATGCQRRAVARGRVAAIAAARIQVLALSAVSSRSYARAVSIDISRARIADVSG